ncbi:MAG: GTP-binding protein [Candidatus Altiarchaeota archaeon]
MARELMRIVMVGHVDHGKSTLIGRLLFDTKSISEERIAAVTEICEKQGKDIEFAYLLDALEEEQQQNVTIDTTQIFFKTKKRDYVVIDAPGHKEFLKNMISGASYAEAAVLIVDAKEGVKEQTKRHAYILNLLGIRQVVVAVNKMDLVEYSQSHFESVKEKISRFLDAFDIMPTAVLPLSASQGYNVAEKSDKLSWFEGETFLQTIDSLKKGRGIESLPFRMPVQDIYKWENKRRIVGRIESGRLKVGDEIVVLPSNKKTKVKNIDVYGKKPKKSEAGECIGVITEDELFVERGEVLSHPDKQPTKTKSFKANLFWMGKNPLKTSGRYKLKLATEEIDCTVSSILRRINSSTLEVIEENAGGLENTEVGELVVTTKKDVALDLFNLIPTTGRFVLVDGKRVAGGGIITEVVYDTIVVKDLRGAECPFTLDHAKPIVDGIKKGQTIEILITNFPAVETVGRLAFENNLEFSFKREEDYIRLSITNP